MPAAIFVEKMLDSKQDNSNENNEDSERNKEVEKDLDDQKEKADNQDSKDEVKNSDSKSILLPLFIFLGLAVVVGTIVYFVCKGRRKNISLQNQKTIINTSTNEKSNNVNDSSLVSESKNDDNESKSSEFNFNDDSSEFNLNDESESEDNEPENKLELEKNVEKLYERLKIIKVDVEKVWTLEKLKGIFEHSSNLVLETLLEKGNKELEKLWFCNENAEKEENMKVLFYKGYKIVFKKFFGGDLESEKEKLFSLFINTDDYSLKMLLDLFCALNKKGFYNIDLTTEIAKILLKDFNFTARLAIDDEKRIIDFTAAILTGRFKEGQTSFKVNIEDLSIKDSRERISFSYTFKNSPVVNLNALLDAYERVLDHHLSLKFLEEVANEYESWVSKQQQQEDLNKNNVENIIDNNLINQKN